MGRVAVVGSGPTGIGVAKILVDAGIGVTLIDASDTVTSPSLESKMPVPPPDPAVVGDAVSPGLLALLGELPATLLRKRVFGSGFVFDRIDDLIPVAGPWLPRSAARGGLANVWGAGCYPLRREDYDDWPVDADALDRWFGPATELLHVSGTEDGLSGAYRPERTMRRIEIGGGGDPDSPIEALLARWDRSRKELTELGLHAGRARLAVLPRNSGEPGACESCGRCLEGCPVEAIWNGRRALRGLIVRGLDYRPGHPVRRWTVMPDGAWLECGEIGAPERRLGPFEALFLAAGPLSSFRIAAQSVPNASARSARMFENDVTILPFILPPGLAPTDRRFALSEAAIAIDPRGALKRPAHLQLYRPGGATLGPLAGVVDRMPRRLRGAITRVFGRLALGLLYLHGDQSRSLGVRLSSSATPIRAVEVFPEPSRRDNDAECVVIERLSNARRLLSLEPISSVRRKGGPGFSAHLGGTLPLRRTPDRLECHPDGRLAGSEDGPPVFVADLSSFPAMPAQNPTLTGVANAMRIAAEFVRANA